MIETRTVHQRLEDLEHDNNVLRSNLADVTADNSRMRHEFEELGRKCERLIAKVNEFVGRFSVVQ
jgi:predicted nuclease with TOPRIM domain